MSDIAASLASLASLSQSVSSMSVAMASMSLGMNEILTAIGSVHPTQTVDLLRMQGRDMSMSDMSMSGMDHGDMSMDHSTMDHGTMDHGTMDHGDTAQGTAGSATDHGSAGADMGDMDGMDHGGMDHGGMGGCKISMLWNWNTIDACFISSQWHITTRGMFAGTCIGVFAWVLALEVLRRIIREFDRFIVRSRRASSPSAIATSKDQQDSLSSDHGAGGAMGAVFSSGFLRPYLWQQVIRAALRTIDFGASFLLMLMGMYYNGYILITIWISMFIASFILNGDTVLAANTELNCHC